MFQIDVPKHLHDDLSKLPQVTASPAPGEPHTIANEFGGLSFSPAPGNKMTVTVTHNPLNLPEHLIKERLEIDLKIFSHVHAAKHA